jgi:hypothetical protein
MQEPTGKICVVLACNHHGRAVYVSAISKVGKASNLDRVIVTEWWAAFQQPNSGPFIAFLADVV